MLNRKSVIHGLSASASAPLFSSVASAAQSTKIKTSGKPKRVIFFLQNQGMEEGTCFPEGLDETQSLDGVKLPEPIQALEPYRERMNIIKGIHGKHTQPSHSAFFGALGGYRGGDGVPPAGKTIDHVISTKLPETILPLLCIGMDSIEAMRARPTISTLSATGPGEGIAMYSNPNLLYKTLFGAISSDKIKKQYIVDSKILNKVQELASKKGSRLPAVERHRYSTFLKGFDEMNSLREKLQGVSSHLKKFKPKYDSRYNNPEFETDWHEALLDMGIAALQSGITNTLTIGSGRGQIFGSWKGAGVEEAGHNLGHMKQVDNPIWIKIRQYNCKLLIRLIKELESIPEDGGTMMDNTLIVYTSNNAEKQHTDGSTWPIITLGNCSGQIKTGSFVKVNGKRSLNSFYLTLLDAIGSPEKTFNMDETMAKKFDDRLGPIDELLA